jgi:hypothetical protein
MKRLASLLICIATLLSLPAVAQSPANGGAATDNMRILREKMMGDKKLIVAANMALTDAESKAFWPIYDAYQAELHKINEQLGTIIADYARMHNAGKLTDARARALMDRYLGAEEAEVRLKRTFAKRLDKVLPGMKVTRYLQIENKIRAIVKYELAGEVPLAK